MTPEVAGSEEGGTKTGRAVAERPAGTTAEGEGIEEGETSCKVWNGREN